MMRKTLMVIATAIFLAGCNTSSDHAAKEPRFRIGKVTVTPSGDPGSTQMAHALERRLDLASRQCMTRVPTDLPTYDLKVTLTHYNHVQPVGPAFFGRSGVRGNAIFVRQSAFSAYRFKLIDDPEENFSKILSRDSQTFFGPELTRDRMAYGVTGMILHRLYPECRGYGPAPKSRGYHQRSVRQDKHYQPLTDGQKDSATPQQTNPNAVTTRPPTMIVH